MFIPQNLVFRYLAAQVFNDSASALASKTSIMSLFPSLGILGFINLLQRSPQKPGTSRLNLWVCRLSDFSAAWGLSGMVFSFGVSMWFRGVNRIDVVLLFMMSMLGGEYFMADLLRFGSQHGKFLGLVPFENKVTSSFDFRNTNAFDDKRNSNLSSLQSHD